MEKLARLYRNAALLLLNTLVALLLVNLALAAVFGIRDRIVPARAGSLRYSSDALDRAYPGMSRGDRDSMLSEVWSRRLEFEPYTMFREPQSRGRFVNVSAAGFRLVPDQGPWPIRRENINIFVFGGSTTFGYGVADDQTIAAHLQDALRRGDGRPRQTCVYNFGRAYYFSTQERVLFEQLLLAGQVPDVAIFVDGLNDFYYAEGEREMADAFRKALDARPAEARTDDLLRSLAGRSPLGRLARVLAGDGARASPPAPGEPAPTPGSGVADSTRIAAVVGRYLENQKLIEAAAAAHRVRAVFVWQPVPTYRYDLARHAFLESGFARHSLSGPGYEWFAAALASGAVRAGPGFLWCADIAEHDTEPCYVDKVHYSGRMCARIADEIVRQARTRGLLAGTGARPCSGRIAATRTRRPRSWAGRQGAGSCLVRLSPANQGLAARIAGAAGLRYRAAVACRVAAPEFPRPPAAWEVFVNEMQRPPAFISAPPRRVVFLCVHNSSRSQIAEGFGLSMAPPGTQIWSAGTKPREVHPLAVEVMKEIGIDLTGQRSKHLDEVPWQEADTVVTLCGEGGDACPVLATTVRRVHWPLPDPSVAPEETQLTAFREVRDEIRWRVSSLWPRED